MPRIKGPPTEMVHIRLRLDLIAAVDRLLEQNPKLGHNRTEFVRRLIEKALEKPPPKRKRGS